MLIWHRLALHVAASSWIFAASFVDHESTVSYVSVYVFIVFMMEIEQNSILWVHGNGQETGQEQIRG